MQKIANIAKNTSYLTFALILQKIISFSYFTILARNLGPENLGKYYFAISFTTIFSIFTDFGLSNILTREIAKFNHKAKEILSNIFFIKILLSFFTLIVLYLFVKFSNYNNLVKNLIYLSSLCMILDSFTASLFGAIRGFHNLIYESIASVIFQVITIISGLYFLYNGYSMVFIIGSLVLASIFNFLFSTFILWKKWKLFIIPSYNKNVLRNLIILAIPFGIYVIFQRFFVYFDSVLLSHFSGDVYVGYYQVAFKIIFALQFLPMAFVASLYPAMSTYWLHNREQLAITYERAMNYLIIISLPISIGIISLADKIILIFKSGYEQAILPLQITMASLLFIFINFPIGSLLNACDKQRQNTINIAIVSSVSIILNFFLIYRFQAIGASITSFICNVLFVILGWRHIGLIINYKQIAIFKTFFKSFFSALVMGLFVILLKNFMDIFLLIIISGTLYFAIMLVIKGFKKEDIVSVWESFAKKV